MLLELTDGRTGSTRELTAREALYLCGYLNGQPQDTDAERAMIRRRRSGVLARMQRYGVDTTDWDRVDAFCLNPRIAGKRFCRLSGGELLALTARLEAMLRKRKEAEP